MAKRLIFLLILGAVLSFGCGRTQETQPEPSVSSASGDRVVLRVHFDTPMTTIDPAYVSNESEITVAKLIFQGLVMETASGIKPAVAKSWEVSPDGMTYTFHLNSGVYFHNGKRVTAGDFKFSWERVLRLKAPSAYLFANIIGADKVLSGEEKVAPGIVAFDDMTLIVTLTQPQDNFVNSLVHPAGAVLDRYEVVEQGIDFGKPGTLSQPALIPSGAGPFSLVEWIDGRNVTLKRNEQYFGNKPEVWRLEFFFNQTSSDAVFDFFSGRYDIVQDVTGKEMPKLLSQPADFSVVEKPVREFRYVAINAALPPFQVKEIRDAAMLALNREEILKAERGTSGNPLDGFLTDYWYNQSVAEKTYFTYSPDESVRLLEQSGHPGGKGLPELTLYCGPTDHDREAAEKIGENLSQVGFKIKVQSLLLKDLRRVIRNGEAAIYTAKYAAKSLEIDTFFLEQVDSQWQKTIVNPAWDQQIAAAAQQKQEERLNTYRQLEKEITDDTRIKYLYSYRSAVLLSPKIQNFQLTPGNNILFEEIKIVQEGNE